MANGQMPIAKQNDKTTNKKIVRKMKKLIITTAIVLGLSLSSFADPNSGGVFGRGESIQNGGNRESTMFAPKLPNHGQNTNQPAPIGSGILVLAAFGTAYAFYKKRKD